MDARLSPEDFEELSAYRDGELTGPAMSRVEGMLRTSPAWKGGLEGLEALDRALEAYAAPPAPADLAGRILQRTARRRAWFRRGVPRLRWLAPLAAAAALLAAVLLHHAITQRWHPGQNVVHRAPPPRPPLAGQNEAAPLPEDETAFEEPPRLAELDDLVEDNLDFFRDLGVVNNLDTIEAIYNQQQTRGEGT